MLDRVHPYLDRLLALVADIDLARRIGADQHHGKAGRQPVLAIGLDGSDSRVSAQTIVYSVGAAPSAIWRDQVLMRCGPAYGLDGVIRPGGQAQNRVLIDGLPKDGLGFQARQDPQSKVLHLALEQAANGGSGRLRSAAVF